MSEATTGPEPEQGPPPWIQPSVQSYIEWRDNDILISVPGKSGTTWTMNIVYQMLTGGDPDFSDIYAEVPWIEFISHPDQIVREIVDRVTAMTTDRPRAFKTHSAPPDLPFIAPGTGKNLKYIVVCRNPEEAVVSFWPFLAQHTDEWFELWGIPKEDLVKEEFADFYWNVVDARGMQGMYFGFLAGWWPLRHQPNVMFIHYADMKRDHEGALRRISEFLGVSPGAEQWRKIAEYTSFDWMKQHREKFDAMSVSEVPLLKTGAMIRKGRAGEAKADGMTDEIVAHLREVGSNICPDPEALDWMYKGGEIPA